MSDLKERCWMSVARAAIWLDCNPMTIRRWIANGRIVGAVNLGGEGKAADIRIPSSALQAAMERLPAAKPIAQPVFARTEGELRRKVAKMEKAA